MHLLQVYSNFDKTSNNGHELLMAIVDSPPRATEVEASTPGRAKRLRDKEVDLLVARYNECRNMRVVARDFRMSRTTVAKLLAGRGIETSRSMKPAEVKQTVQMYGEGMSSITIGKQLGFDNHTVLAALRKEGVTIRESSSLRHRQVLEDGKFV